ncbi:MAG: choice-of-anchor D domain-containing protein [Verrucomicrobia bacterium]|nr:choice-of-anchor D domain-containing protein [Verrucomicrobiota bacterium]
MKSPNHITVASIQSHVRPAHFAALLLLAAAGLTLPAPADTAPSQEAKLTASDGAGGDNFGNSVFLSADGNTALVGAPWHDTAEGTDAGSAYVFVRTEGGWTEQACLTASDGGSYDYFGEDVSLSSDGHTAIVGAGYADTLAGTEAGSAYVFVRSGNTWSQQTQLRADDESAESYFGWTVSLSKDGNTALVGAGGGDKTPGGNEGAAYLFVRSGSNWTQQAKLTASDGAYGDWFGYSTCLNGDGTTALVGALYDGTEIGSVYVFVRSETNWSQQAKLTAGAGRFGVSVSLDDNGNTALVGAYFDDRVFSDDGSAYVFVRSGSNWTEQAQLAASDGAERDLFGISVSLSSDGNTALVGAVFDDTPAGANAGSAYLFVRRGGNWTQQVQLTANDGAASDFFGHAVSLSGDGSMALVSAYGHDTQTGTEVGSAYVFQLGTPAPEIAVQQPAGTDLVDNSSTVAFGLSPVGMPTAAKTFTVRNSGDGPLTGLGVTTSGTHAAEYAVNTTGFPGSLDPGASATFTVTFTPATAGARTATLLIASNDADENPFEIALTGQGLSFTTDADGDGLNDASEFQMAALGFDWQVAQPALVNTYYSSANGAGLYTTAQVQAIHVGTPLLQRDASGTFTLTLALKKSTDFATWQPFPFTEEGISLNAQGDLEFQFTSPDNAAFFRLEAH